MIHNDPPIVSETPLQSNLISLVAQGDSKSNKKTNQFWLKNRKEPIKGIDEVLRRARKRVKATKGYSEDQLQIALAIFLDDLEKRTEAFDWFHIPNGGARNPREGAKFKRMGVKAGVSDNCIRANNGKSIWIELKISDGPWGEHQQTFCKKSLKRGHSYHLVRGDFPIEINQQVSKILRDEGVLI